MLLILSPSVEPRAYRIDVRLSLLTRVGFRAVNPTYRIEPRRSADVLHSVRPSDVRLGMGASHDTPMYLAESEGLSPVAGAKARLPTLHHSM